MNNDIDQRFENFKIRKNIVVYGLPEGEGREEKDIDQNMKVLIK